jgi:plastocyanin
VGNNYFSPSSITIPVGGTVTWAWVEGVHSVTSDTGLFDSGIRTAGATFQFTFTAPGDYEYYCLVHSTPDGSAQNGVVHVVGPPTATPTLGPSPTPTTSPTPTATKAPPSGDVQVGDNFFNPGTITIPVGGTVTWAFIGNLPHTTTSVSGPESWDSGVKYFGDTFARTFGVPGTYDYICTIHPEMRGTVNVVGPTSTPTGTPTAGPSPTPTVTATPSPTPTPRPTAVAGAAEVRVSMGDNFFAPETVTVRAGDTVTWVNDGRIVHTATGWDAARGLWDSGLLQPGQSFSFRFAQPGTYPYLCVVHPVEMRGTVVVVEAEAPLGEAPAGEEPPAEEPPAEALPPAGPVAVVPEARPASVPRQLPNTGVADAVSADAPLAALLLAAGLLTLGVLLRRRRTEG